MSVDSRQGENSDYPITPPSRRGVRLLLLKAQLTLTRKQVRPGTAVRGTITVKRFIGNVAEGLRPIEPISRQQLEALETHLQECLPQFAITHITVKKVGKTYDTLSNAYEQYEVTVVVK